MTSAEPYFQFTRRPRYARSRSGAQVRPVMPRRTPAVLRRFLAPVLLMSLVLGGCDFFTDTSTEQSQVPETSDNEFDTLVRALETKPLVGSRLVSFPERLDATIIPRGSFNETVRLTNTGDKVAELTVVTLGSGNPRLTLSGTCATERSVAPGASCTLTLVYSDADGLTIETAILVLSDSNNTPELRIPVRIVVQAPPAPPRPVIVEPVAPPPPPPPAIIPQYDPFEQELRRQQKQRRSPRQGNGLRPLTGLDPAGNNLRPRDAERFSIVQASKYPDGMFQSVETTLPVDRARILTPDRVIKAVLETPIHTSFEGLVIANVQSHVFSPSTREVLIPAGTKFIGRTVGISDERVALNWERFITPSGVSVRMNGIGYDQMGRPGVPGFIDRRYWQRFGLPLLMSAVTSLIDLKFGDDESTTTDADTNQTTSSTTARNRAIENFRENVEGVGERIIAELSAVRTVVQIPAGTLIDIVPVEDIYFKTEQEMVRLDGYDYALPSEGDPAQLAVTPAPPYATRPEQAIESPETTVGPATVIMDGTTYRLVPSGTGTTASGGAGGAPRPVTGRSGRSDSRPQVLPSPSTVSPTNTQIGR